MNQRELVAFIRKVGRGGILSTDRTIDEKLADSVSVQDFGAVADGSTDDSAAFAAALSSGKHVFVPYGVYSAGDLTLSSSHQTLWSNGAVVKPPAGAKWFAKISGFRNQIAGLYIDDALGNIRAATTLTGGGTTSSTSITISSSSRVYAGQRCSIRLDSGSFFTTWISALAGTTVTLADALPSAAANGNAFLSSYGVITLQDAVYWNVSDVVVNGGGIMMDDPSPGSYGGVTKGTARDVVLIGARIFGLIKGRNCGDNRFVNVHGRGGYTQTDTATGNGVQTAFPLSQQVYLRREIAVYVGGVLQTISTHYTLSSDGLTVNFLSAPANGAAVSFVYAVYGAEGYVEDCRSTTTVSGGNQYTNGSWLGFRRGIDLFEAQLYSLTDVIADTCSENAIRLSATTQVGQLTNCFFGWAPTNISLINTALGVKMNGCVSKALPSNTSCEGSAGSEISIGSGSKVDGTLFKSSGGLTIYANGAVSFDIDSSGNMSFGSTTKTNKWSVQGTSGALGFNTTGDTLAFSGSGFSYINVAATNGRLVMQASGTNGAVQIDAKANALVTINGTDRIQANGTGLGFFAASPVAKPTVSGSRDSNAALASLLTALASLGLVTDSTS